jgi:hypothetical protein
MCGEVPSVLRKKQWQQNIQQHVVALDIAISEVSGGKVEAKSTNVFSHSRSADTVLNICRIVSCIAIK